MILTADTVTKVGPEARNGVLVCGSHGGLYPGYLAAKAGVKAVIFNDAGGGKAGAGYGSLGYLADLGVAAATVSHLSCRIGDSADMMGRGVISQMNALAAGCGVLIGMGCTEAAAHLTATPEVSAQSVPHQNEARRVLPNEDGALRQIILIDSASLVRPEDQGQIVVTGSHGGLLGGKDFMALQVAALAGVFHDAGNGIEDAGLTRLPALDRRGIAGVTVAGTSARIGDAASVFNDGIISAANEIALARGAKIGAPVAALLREWSRSAP